MSENIYNDLHVIEYHNANQKPQKDKSTKCITVRYQDGTTLGVVSNTHDHAYPINGGEQWLIYTDDTHLTWGKRSMYICDTKQTATNLIISKAYNDRMWQQMAKRFDIQSSLYSTVIGVING